jgi:DNA mismatch repair protein MutS2
METISTTYLNFPEWSHITESIAEFFFFDLNKELTTNHSATVLDYNQIQQSFDQLQFFQEYLLDEYSQTFSQLLLPLDPQVSLPELTRHISKNGFVGIKEQNTVVLAVESAYKISRSSSRHELNPLTRIIDLPTNAQLTNFIRDFRFLISRDGHLDYNKHPELQKLYISLHDLEGRIRKNLGELIRSEDWKNILQYDGFDLIDERYVLPVRTDSFKSTLGFIISRSESGHTLFVEPHVMREHSLKRLEIVSLIKDITFQIESNFFKRLFENITTISLATDSLIEFDYCLGRSRFCMAKGLSRPLKRARPGFVFHDLFHPLIPKPVKNDIYLDSAQTALVISGPNTGGKTAIIKAIAISYKFYLSGLFVPALHAELFHYDVVFFSANDLQDIEKGLSSFSGEVTFYLQLSENLKSNNLILIDEIFNSTSSDEASVLTLSMIDNFNLRKNTHFVISTHHQLLKNLASERPTIISGSMGYDVDKMKPSYRFYQGVPGQSMAIDIFEKLAQNNPYGTLIGNEARHLLDKKQVNYEKLVSQVALKNRELDELITANRSKEKELLDREKSLEGIMRIKLSDEISRAKEHFNKIHKQALETIESIKTGHITKVKKVDDIFSGLSKDLNLENESDAIASGEQFENTLAIHQLRPGNIYFNVFLKKEVQLQSIDWRRKQAIVTKGALTVNVPLNSFQKGVTTVNSFQQIRISVSRNAERPFILDCRGMRLEEFQHQVEKGLADLLAGDSKKLNIIHGHGDGVLKSWLRSKISKSKDFRWSVPENGNDGETEIELKD